MLMPVSALPGAYGIGCFSKEAYEFVDILKEAGQKLWQILPLGQTGYGDSPYQSFSTFAGNPYFIDLETLIEDELLTKEECDQADFGENEEEIDYEKIYNARFNVLKKAFEASAHKESDAYKTFLEDNKDWLHDYAVFMAIKGAHDNREWLSWEEDIRFRKPEAVAEYESRLAYEIDFYKIFIFLFCKLSDNCCFSNLSCAYNTKCLFIFLSSP